jgi:hypothetical protein
MPHRTHVVTCRDTREVSDWLTEVRHPSLSRLQVLINLTYEDNLLVQRAVRQADGVYCAAQFLRAKAQRKYGLDTVPRFLPTPVAVPPTIQKASQPTVCYLARWDRRKRPELFLELARKFTTCASSHSATPVISNTRIGCGGSTPGSRIC